MPLARAIPEEHLEDEGDVTTLLAGFLRRFEDASGDRVFQQLMIQASPALTGSPVCDGMIAAVGEHLSLKAGLMVPQWVHEKARCGPRSPTLQPSVARMFPEAGTTPLAFRKRNIHSGL